MQCDRSVKPPHPVSSFTEQDILVAQLIKEFPAFYGTKRFITMLEETAAGPYAEPV
jgi:hypothetical protein